MKTREQLRKRYKAVSVDGDKDASEFRVKQRGFLGIGWVFVNKSSWIVKDGIDQTFRIIEVDGASTFHTEREAQRAIDRWVEEDYRAQPAAWMEVVH